MGGDKGENGIKETKMNKKRRRRRMKINRRRRSRKRIRVIRRSNNFEKRMRRKHER